jgi:hypothetical protein
LRRNKLAMNDDRPPPFDLPAVARKKVTAAFDGGRITSDGGVMLLAAADRRLGLCEKLAARIMDPRDPRARPSCSWRREGDARRSRLWQGGRLVATFRRDDLTTG